MTERQIRELLKRPMEDTMTKVEGVYAKFEALEEEIAHCYFLLHERFIANPRLSRFWAEAALDEMQHSSILRFCRERGLMAEVDVDSATAARIDELLDVVKNIVSDPEVTVDEAFYASLLLESSELDETYEHLTRALAKDHLLLHQAIEAGMRSHHGNFIDGAEEFSVDKAVVEAFKAFGEKRNTRIEKGRFT